MKKNNVMRIASALLVAVLLTTCAISGTFAKYTTSADGTATARVAKWAFTVGGNALAEDFEFDLIATLTEYEGGEETDVGLDVLAPGTAGSFVVALTNDSEVNARYNVSFTESISNLPAGLDEDAFPVEYTTTPDNDQSWSADISRVVANGTIDMDATENITVYWRWAFEGDNDYDTAIGTAGNVEVVITATVTVTQEN